LVLNLTQAVERELAVNRRQLRIASPSAPTLPLSLTLDQLAEEALRDYREGKRIVMLYNAY
jgi:hypothetical protein